MRVLAVGATGQFAGLVVPTLVSRGVQVTAFVHDPAKQDRARDAGADEAVAGDLRDPASVRAALGGVDGVFLIIPAFAPDSATLGMVTRTEIAALMTRYARREVTAQDADPGTALQGIPDGSVRNGLLAMFTEYTAHGFHGGNSLALRTILGPPCSLDDFFAELAR